MATSLKVYCNSCKSITNHEVLKFEERESFLEEEQIGFYDCWQIIQCLGCEDISFRLFSTNSEAYDYETGKPCEYITLYPNRSDKALEIKPYYNVPSIVKKIFVETIEAYNNGLNILCAAGLRAIIEGICKNENITDGPVEQITKTEGIKVVRSNKLIGKINGLLEKGIITKKQVEILHQPRFLGNEALHDLEAPKTEILRIAIEIIEHMLDSLYEMDDRSEILSRLRKQQLNRKKNSIRKKEN